MENEKNSHVPKNIQEDEDGTRQLLTPYLSKDTRGKSTKGSKWYDWLSHPLLLLIFTAIITGLLVPYLTRGWQDYQRALDLKASLVNDINESTESAFTELETVENRYEFTSLGKNQNSINLLQTNFINEYHNWRTKGKSIQAQLLIYFDPQKHISDKWGAFINAINYMYYLSQVNDINARFSYVMGIQSTLQQFGIKNTDFVNHLLSYKTDSKYGDNLLTMNTNCWFHLEDVLRVAIRDKQILPLLIGTPIMIRST